MTKPSGSEGQSSTTARRRPPGRKKGSIGGGNPVADDVEHSPPVSPLAGAPWAPRIESPGGAPAAAFQPPVPQIPTPYEDDGGSPKLSGTERQHLATCEAAIDALRTAAWAAGKALQVIRDARLYKEDYESFEDYLVARWDMSRPQAYRLIDAWPLADALSPMGDINERQVRELLPVADQHGRDAAIAVYRTITETDGVKVTAAVIKGAVSVLPSEFNVEEAVTQIRAYLAGELAPQPPAPANPGKQVERVRATIRRINVTKLRDIELKTRREFAKELRALADELSAE